MAETAETEQTTLSDEAPTCVGCGYQLRGLAVDATCPECGESVRRSILSARGFTKREVAVLAVRLFALWLALRGLWSVLRFGVAAQEAWPTGSSADWAILLWFGVYAAINMALAGALWWAGPRFGRLLVRRDGPAHTGGITANQLMQVAFSVVGLYLLASGLARAGGYTGYWLFREAGGYHIFGQSEFLFASGQSVIGLIILARGPLKRLIPWLRTAGQHPPDKPHPDARRIG
jgi:predicted RNA-binding Zn-ribbon protein involved in translation (DUF1610 family)